MPILRTQPDGALGNAPEWSELERCFVVGLESGKDFTWDAATKSNKLVVVNGSARIDGLTESGQQLDAGQTIDLASGSYTVVADEPATVVAFGGQWGSVTGGSGVFRVAQSDQPDERGDPADYPKNTSFDRHYHDCDEYWVVIKGSGKASSENILHEICPGEIVATRMGNHHDLCWVDEPVLGVFFETTMGGKARRGHLWEHTHGPAVPRTDGRD